MENSVQSKLFQVAALPKVKDRGKLQRKAFQHLMDGCHIVDATEFNCGYRRYDRNKNPLLKLTESMFNEIRHLLKRDRKHPSIFVISRSSVRREHGNNFYKKVYRLWLLQKRTSR